MEKNRAADVDPATLSILTKKARRSPCTYKISGIAYSKKGNVLGIATNSHSKWDVMTQLPVGRPGTAEHCERVLMKKFKNQIKTIVICRVGRSGNVLPIDPCPVCAKLAKKYGITILTVKA